jgi:hypothetical protein
LPFIEAFLPMQAVTTVINKTRQIVESVLIIIFNWFLEISTFQSGLSYMRNDPRAFPP